MSTPTLRIDSRFISAKFQDDMESDEGSPTDSYPSIQNAERRAVSSKRGRRVSNIANIMSANVSNARARLGSASSSSSRASAGRSGVEGGESDVSSVRSATPITRNVVGNARGGGGSSAASGIARVGNNTFSMDIDVDNGSASSRSNRGSALPAAISSSRMAQSPNIRDRRYQHNHNVNVPSRDARQIVPAIPLPLTSLIAPSRAVKRSQGTARTREGGKKNGGGAPLAAAFDPIARRRKPSVSVDDDDRGSGGSRIALVVDDEGEGEGDGATDSRSTSATTAHGHGTRQATGVFQKMSLRSRAGSLASASGNVSENHEPASGSGINVSGSKVLRSESRRSEVRRKSYVKSRVAKESAKGIEKPQSVSLVLVCTWSCPLARYADRILNIIMHLGHKTPQKIPITSSTVWFVISLTKNQSRC